MAFPPLPSGSRAIAEELTASLETYGYRLNHTMLHIKNPSRSLQFYSNLLGMSLIFRLNAGPFTIYYLGYASSEDKVPSDIATSMSSRSGLLELMHFHNASTEDAQTTASCKTSHDLPTPEGFGHLGLVVPDVEQTLNRARQMGYVLLKDVTHTSGAALGLPKEADAALHPDFLAAYAQIGFLYDPDGHVVEVLPQKFKD